MSHATAGFTKKIALNFTNISNRSHGLARSVTKNTTVDSVKTNDTMFAIG